MYAFYTALGEHLPRLVLVLGLGADEKGLHVDRFVFARSVRPRLSLSVGSDVPRLQHFCIKTMHLQDVPNLLDLACSSTRTSSLPFVQEIRVVGKFPMRRVDWPRNTAPSELIQSYQLKLRHLNVTLNWLPTIC